MLRSVRRQCAELFHEYDIVNTSTMCHSNQKEITELRNNELLHKYATLFKLTYLEARDKVCNLRLTVAQG